MRAPRIAAGCIWMTQTEDMPSESLVEAIYDGIVEMPGWSTFLEHCTRVFGVTAASILIETHSLGHPERLRLFSPNVGAAMGDRIDAFASTAIFAGEQDERIADFQLPLSHGEPANALRFSALIP